MSKRFSLLRDIEAQEGKIEAANIQREQAKNILLLPTRSEKALKGIGEIDAAGIRQFQTALKHLGKSYRVAGIAGGIRARTVINRSRGIDIKRCREEIPHAKPVSVDKFGVVRFWVSASGKYGDTSHYVVVQFLNFSAATAGHAGLNDVLNGALKFDCDCGRHRFWYRYIATVGGFNYGRGESGFPKIRNPDLRGLGCKHVLRVMLVIEKSAAFRAFMKQAIERYRKSPNARRYTQTTQQAEKMAAKMARESWQNKQVRRSKHDRQMPLKTLPKTAFDRRSPKSIKGADLKPIDISKARQNNMSRPAMEREIAATAQMLQMDLSGLNQAQLREVQAYIAKIQAITGKKT